MRKAYDRVEREYLKAIMLRLVGFPPFMGGYDYEIGNYSFFLGFI
jgi:hypothetical protein